MTMNIDPQIEGKFGETRDMACSSRMGYGSVAQRAAHPRYGFLVVTCNLQK